MSDKSRFAKYCVDLLWMTDSVCGDINNQHAVNQLLSRLKEYNEFLENKSEVRDFMHLKLKLLRNLIVIIVSMKKDDQKCSMINCITNIIKTSVIDDIEFFIFAYNSIFYQIYQEQNISLSEEIKLAVLECSTELIKKSSKTLLQILYDYEYSAKFSMGILIAVQIAKEEKSFKLRVTALDFLLFAMQYHRRNDKVLQSAVGNLFMFYLPGVIRRVQEIIFRDETQPHLITVKAINCWGQLLCTVMRDIDDDESLSDEEQINLWRNLSKETNREEKGFDKSALEGKNRTKNWLQAAAQTLRPLIWKMPEARKHSHPKVRLNLTVEIAHLLENCLMSLRTALNPMLEILISSCEDEESEIRDVAELSLVRFESRCQTKSGKVFLNVIEENLNSLIGKMPNVIHLRDDPAILNAMQTLCGELKILCNSGRLDQTISFSSNLTRLIGILIVCARLELYPEVSIQDYSIWDNELNSTVWIKQWKRFKHFTDVKITSKLAEICSLLARTRERETILDYLFDRFREDYSHRNEILLLANEVVSSSSDIPPNNIKQFLDLYLDPDNLYLTLEVDDDECQTLQQSKNNIITVALLMEGIGKLANVIGRRFDDYLLKSLYYVIEKMGSSYRIIRTSAMRTANQISRAVGQEGNIELLIQNNVDYLTYHITTKLKRNHSGVFDVITVLIKNSPFEAITNLEEIINDVLRSSSKKFSSPHTVSYLRLYQTFVQCVSKWLETVDTNVVNEETVSEKKTDVDMLLEFIEEKQKSGEDSDDNDMEMMSEHPTPEVEPDNRDEEDDTFQKDKKKLPKHIQLTIGIAENALNYLPSNDFDKKLLVLEILNESILILSNWENELLPLVHKIWSPLVTRFEKLIDPLMINRSFTLLYSMSRTSKDFIRRRTLKNVLPTLRTFLFKSSENSRLKDSGSGYQFTQGFKLQAELLDKLGTLAIDLCLSGKELDSIAECALPYLSALQPPLLQEKCRKLFSDLKDYDPYLVWYKLHRLKNDTELSKNVEIVLEYLMPEEKLSN